MITTSRLGLTVWNLGSDPYSHLQLAANWQTIDDLLLKRTGDTATGTMRVQVGNTSIEAFGVKLTSDTDARIKLHADALYFGNGAGVFDVKLYRSAADKLALDDQLEILYSGASSLLSSNGSSIALEGYKLAAQSFVQNKLLSTDAQPSFRIFGNGEHNFGVGGSTATDVRLYRSSSGTLTIDSNLVVTNLEATNSITIGGILLNVSGGNIQSNASLITSNVIRARDGFTGRTQMGDTSDNTRSIIFFGGGADVNLYRDGVDRLRTDDSLITAGFLQVNSTAVKSIEAEGGIDIAGISVLSGAVTMGAAASIAGNLTLIGGAGVSGRTPIGSNTLLGDVIRGKQSWLESTTNSNLWYLANINSDLSFRTTTYNAGGPGGSDTERFKISASGAVTMGTLAATTITVTGLTVNGSGSITGNLNVSGTVTSGALTTGVINSGQIIATGTVTATGASFSGAVSGTGFSGATFVASSLMTSNIISTNSLSVGAGGAIVNGWIQVNNGRIECYSASDGQIIGRVITATNSMNSPGYNVTSDARLKTKPKNHPELLDKIKGMESLGQWRWSKTALAKTDIEADHTEAHFGPTAQEFNKIFKGLEDDSNEPQGINVADMAGLALMGIKELINRVESLESQEK